MLVGFVYPSYASWKALESRKGEGSGSVVTAGEAATQSRDAWLTYWVVFSAFNVVEHLLDWLVSWCAALRVPSVLKLRRQLLLLTLSRGTPRIPFYFVAKLAFVVWLQAPQTRVRHSTGLGLSASADPCCSLPKGATVLYVQYISPLIRKHETQIDHALEEGMKRSETTLSEFRARGLGIFGRGSGTDGMAPSKDLSES